MWDLWWTQWHWGRFLSGTSGLPRQLSCHQCSILSSGPGTTDSSTKALSLTPPPRISSKKIASKTIHILSRTRVVSTTPTWKRYTSTAARQTTVGCPIANSKTDILLLSTYSAYRYSPEDTKIPLMCSIYGYVSPNYWNLIRIFRDPFE
jgi:hypothetical protein